MSKLNVGKAEVLRIIADAIEVFGASFDPGSLADHATKNTTKWLRQEAANVSRFVSGARFFDRERDLYWQLKKDYKGWGLLSDSGDGMPVEGAPADVDFVEERYIPDDLIPSSRFKCEKCGCIGASGDDKIIRGGIKSVTAYLEEHDHDR